MVVFSEVDQVLRETFVKKNMPKSRFHLVQDTYCRLMFDISSRYTLVPTALTKVDLFEGGLRGIL